MSSNSHFRFFLFFFFCLQLSSGGLHTDLGALPVHIEEGVAGLRDVSGRHPLIVAVDVNVQAVLSVHQHPYPAPTPHCGQVAPVVLLHLHAKPSQGAGDTSVKKEMLLCFDSSLTEHGNLQTSNLLPSWRRS